MIEVKGKSTAYTEANLRNSYIKSLQDSKFRALITKLKLQEKIAMKYTSKLEDSAKELSNCKTCPNILACKNKIEGYVSFPTLRENKLFFSYIACRHMKKHIQDEAENNSQNEIAAASMKDIDITDKKRAKVIKWLKEFYDKYDRNKKLKGLYLHGSFGSGKTYLIAAMLNELAKKRVRTEIAYFPELIAEIKSDFDKFDAKMSYLLNVDILLLDDLGAEKVTQWSRDEILGTILQSRMNNNKTTFFTSNLTIDELENHLCITSGSEDKVKARRIVQRINQLTEQAELISENRRK